jgi:hypothetical protein
MVICLDPGLPLESPSKPSSKDSSPLKISCIGESALALRAILRSFITNFELLILK